MSRKAIKTPPPRLAYLGTNGSAVFHVVTEAHARGVDALCGTVCNSYGDTLVTGRGPSMCTTCQIQAESEGLLPLDLNKAVPVAKIESYGWLPPALREPDFTLCSNCGRPAIGWHERDLHDIVGELVSTVRWTVCRRHASAARRRKDTNSERHRVVLFEEEGF